MWLQYKGNHVKNNIMDTLKYYNAVMVNVVFVLCSLPNVHLWKLKFTWKKVKYSLLL